ncbi:MFS transporter [Solirubrobacter pauli]|uniref:MFS transporter n=1 Tax=Solirubrobacter pauli TaxID=166793 RepID=A0A660L8H2_9ACTN|nr:MFS transporter [Solirubrobacter pauli]RKQ87870.1 MFS transporter [Solirubrobacter pauli]
MLARWGLVAAYAAAAGANQLLWLTYAPITTRTAEHYGVSDSAVGWLSQVFPLLYVLLAIPASIALRRAFRPALLAGAWLTALGGAVRLGDTFTAALIGQILVAIAQPLLLNAVTYVATTAPDEPKGVAIGSAGIFAGTALALPLAPALSIPTLLVVDASVAVVVAIALTATIRPAHAVSTSPLPRRARPALVAFLGFGVFVALMTWLQVLLEPAGVSEDTAGWLLFAMVVSGVASSAFVSPLVIARRKERSFLQLAAVVAAASCLALAVAPGAAWLVVVPLGAVLLGALPVLLNRADPALIWLAGNTGGIVIAVLTQAVSSRPALAFSLLAVIAASVLAVA